MSPSVLVVTVVHHPGDARIRHRQISALLERDWRVTFAAPFTGHGVELQEEVPGLRVIDLTRASGRSRLQAMRHARAVVREEGPRHDLVLLHDPELLPAVAGLRLPTTVWDVHEDTAAAVQVRPWVPGPLRRPIAAGVRLAERVAERRMPLLLADGEYARRFRRAHPVVPNVTTVAARPARAAVPDPDGMLRVVYLGSVTLERGVQEMVAVATALRERTDAVVVEVIGPAHGPAAEILQQASDQGLLRWHGFVPNDQALAMVDGALAGLSLLRDEANFRPSMATKVVEYLARAVPAITTPLREPAALVRDSGGGVIVPFGADTVPATVDTVLAWARDPELARRMGRMGHAAVSADHDWAVHADFFVRTLADLAGGGQSRP